MQIPGEPCEINRLQRRVSKARKEKLSRRLSSGAACANAFRPSLLEILEKAVAAMSHAFMKPEAASHEIQ
jgi:hypothetical protein